MLWVLAEGRATLSVLMCALVHAAKITRCGHVFCWSCMLHYLALVRHWCVHVYIHVRACFVYAVDC